MTDILDRSIVPGAGPLRPFQFPAIETFRLGNGMPVLFARTEGLPVATFSLLLPGGAVREPSDRAGIATLTASTLVSGTADLNAAEIAEKLEAQGVTLQVGTSWDVSHVEFTCLTDRAEPAASIAADLVSGAVFPPAEIERLRQEQLAGILQRRAEPRGLANEMAARFIFSDGSPFARPLAGTAASVGKLGRDDALAFHRASFTPQSSALVVAGLLTSEKVLTIAEAAFGHWQGPPPPDGAAAADPRSTSVRVVVVDRPGAVQSEIRIGHVGVARKTPDFFPILVMNTILGGAFSSRLNLNLREKHGFTYGVNSAFVMRRNPGPFLVSTAVQTEVTGAAVGEILAELKRIREDRADAAELADARQYVAGTFPLRLQTTDGVASRLSELFIYDLPESYLEEFGERVLAVSSDEVLTAARSHIQPDRLMILVVGPAEQVLPQLEALGVGPVEVVSKDLDE